MSTLYLVDYFPPPLGPAPIKDACTGSSVPLAGNYVIRVPDSISVQHPSDVTDLLLKKYQGMLAYYAGYANIAYDDLLDVLDVDTSVSQGYFGEKNTVTILPGGVFQTNAIALVGPNPPEAFVTWETYQISLSDNATARVQPSYEELPSSSAYFTCQVSFNGGANFYPVLDGGLVNIPLVARGTSFVLQLTNVSASPLRVGSWAVIY